MEEDDLAMRKGMTVVFGGIVVLFFTILFLANFIA
jgi:hypothetical protein